MILLKPAYFDSFRCIADRCPDSCCKEWEVQVDGEAAAFYRTLPGPLGDQLRSVLREEDGETLMTIQDGRCPMWRSDGLCRIQAELGEGALCRVCQNFPRLRHDYGDFVELGLELSCPEAARILLTAPETAWVTEEIPAGGEPEYDTETMAVLKATRREALTLLADPRYAPNQVIAQVLLYGYQAQEQLDGGEEVPFDPEAALETGREFGKNGDAGALLAFFRGLEILTPQWAARLTQPNPGPWQEEYRALARYFVERYWLQAVSDYDLVGRVKLMAVSCLVIHLLGGTLTETAQLYAKEIENDADNVEVILDGAYSHPALTDEKLLDLLLRG